jgi:hypothetical protein
VTEDRRHATTEKISLLTTELGATVAQLILLWPWQRMKARVLATHFGKLMSDLYAELGGRASSMAAKAVTRPLEGFEKKLDEIIARQAWIEAKLEAQTEAQQRLDARLTALEAGGE